MSHRALFACLIIILGAANAFAGSGAGVPASYYYIREPVKAFDQFVTDHKVEIPFQSGTDTTGIVAGTSAQGPVYLEIVRSVPGGFFRYALTISRSKEIEGRTKDNTISFNLNYTTQATGRPQRILLATLGEFNEANNWEIQFNAAGHITAVDAKYQGPRFLWGGKKVAITGTFPTQ